jgi:hypothetical protein
MIELPGFLLGCYGQIDNFCNYLGQIFPALAIKTKQKRH